jgi:hypothetical protein
MLQNLNNDQVPHPNSKYNMGDELDVKVLTIADNGFVLTVPITQPLVSNKAKLTVPGAR